MADYNKEITALEKTLLEAAELNKKLSKEPNYLKKFGIKLKLHRLFRPISEKGVNKKIKYLKKTQKELDYKEEFKKFKEATKKKDSLAGKIIKKKIKKEEKKLGMPMGWKKPKGN